MSTLSTGRVISSSLPLMTVIRSANPLSRTITRAVSAIDDMSTA